MLGCSMRPAVVASRMKRATYSGSRPISGGRILTATLRPRPKCSASQTDPMPPVPSFARMRHFSKVLPISWSSCLGPMRVDPGLQIVPSKLFRELHRGGLPPLLFPGESPEADRLELARGPGIQLGRRRRGAVEDAEIDLDDRVAGEGDPPGERLVEHDAEG